MHFFQSPEEFQDTYPLLAMGVTPVKKYNEDLSPEERKQQLNSDDVPMWDVLCSTMDGTRPVNVKVRLASHVEPSVDPGPIRFGGFDTGNYADGARLIITFNADTFTQDPAPSKRAAKAKTAEPPVPNGADPVAAKS